MIFVTHNRHKYEEISKMFSQNGIALRWLNREYEEIQSESIEKVSLESCQRLSMDVTEDFFLEDSGLLIKHYRNFPGPFSSYVYTTLGTDGILKLMEGIDSRDAEFITVISLFFEGKIFQFTGTVRGKISLEKRGESGFGYDPIFIPEGFTNTLSELTTDEKNLISHRGRAVSKLIEFLKKHNVF